MNKTKNPVQEKIRNGAKLILKNKQLLTDKLTDEKIAANCIDHVWSRDSSSGGHKIITNIIPNVNLGYGGTEGGFYGNGPSRLICKANYALRSSYTIPNVQLTSGILNGTSDEFDNLINALSRDYSKQDPKVDFKGSIDSVSKYSKEKRESMLLAVGSLDINSLGTYTSVIVSNIQKDGWNYTGDISIQMVRLFGTGASFFPKKNSYSEEDTYFYHSLKTQDLYNPKTESAKPTSQIFKQKMNSELDAFSKKATDYKAVIENTSNKKLPMTEYHIMTPYNL